MDPRTHTEGHVLPGDRYRMKKLRAMPRMEAIYSNPRASILVSQRQPADLLCIIAGVVASKQDSVRGLEAIARVPYQPGFAVDKRDPAVDAGFSLPEARRLPCDLDRVIIHGICDCLPEGRREVVFDLGEHWQWNRYDRVGGSYRSRFAGAMVDNPHSIRQLANLADLCAEPDLGMEPLRECRGDPVHASNRLQHGRLHYEDV